MHWTKLVSQRSVQAKFKSGTLKSFLKLLCQMAIKRDLKAVKLTNTRWRDRNRKADTWLRSESMSKKRISFCNVYSNTSPFFKIIICNIPTCFLSEMPTITWFNFAIPVSSVTSASSYYLATVVGCSEFWSPGVMFRSEISEILNLSVLKALESFENLTGTVSCPMTFWNDSSVTNGKSMQEIRFLSLNK